MLELENVRCVRPAGAKRGQRRGGHSSGSGVVGAFSAQGPDDHFQKAFPHHG